MPINDEQKIAILIAEYNSFEIRTVTRTGHGFQIAGFSITALSIWAAEETTGKTWLALIAIILLLVGSGWFTFREITKANRRLREIEGDVNDRAGEDLLVWESLWDGWATGFWGRANPRSRAMLRSQAPLSRSRGGTPTPS
jgi:hypothetical protein